MTAKHPPVDRFAIAAPERTVVPIMGTDRLFPVHRIYCVGQNYAAHAREMGASDRERPFFFAKPHDAVCCTDQVPYPAMTEKLHHEIELVVALGNGGLNVEADNALSLVFGYAAGVDLTRRDLQEISKQKGRPWTTAKGFDCSAPLSAVREMPGAALPASAEISLTVNGEHRQKATLEEMIWSVPEIISELSRYFELKPGDLLFTGTPAGVGPVCPGDQVACRIEGVAELAFGMEGATYLPPR